MSLKRHLIFIPFSLNITLITNAQQSLSDMKKTRDGLQLATGTEELLQ